MRIALWVSVVSLAIASAGCGSAAAQAAAAYDSTATMREWGPLAWMIGDWEANGTSAGVGRGTFSVHPDLDGNILIRKNSAPMVNGGIHQDLMILYHTRDGAFRAIYFDNERHVINYAVTPTTAPAVGAVFLSDEAQGMPRFRLTYTMTGANIVKINFELQPPGATEFKTYLEGGAIRK